MKEATEEAAGAEGLQAERQGMIVEWKRNLV